MLSETTGRRSGRVRTTEISTYRLILRDVELVHIRPGRCLMIPIQIGNVEVRASQRLATRGLRGAVAIVSGICQRIEPR